MEFLKVSRRRTILSETVYVLLNVALVVAIVVATVAFNSLWSAVGLVLLSKWRVLAVRPHYWTAHIIANMVDIIVGLSFATFIYEADGALSAQIFLAMVYLIWLLFIKPRSKKTFIIFQGAAALFLGLAALAQVSADVWSSVVVLVSWVIGYSAARHVLLGAYKEAHSGLLSLLSGLFMAELGWVCYHWTVAYQLPFAASVQIAQSALLGLVIAFLAERGYASYKEYKRIRFADVTLPLILSIAMIVVLLVLFGGVKTI